MRYVQAFDIWSVPKELLVHVQPGQWVFAGERDNRGRFWGVKPSGVVVVAWLENARRSGDYEDYMRCLRDYARDMRG